MKKRILKIKEIAETVSKSRAWRLLSSDNTILRAKSPIVDETNGYVYVPLPNANSQWTFESYEWTKKFIKEFKKHFNSSVASVYPDHSRLLEDSAIKYFREYAIEKGCDRLDKMSCPEHMIVIRCEFYDNR